jgi:hypothetical protein
VQNKLLAYKLSVKAIRTMVFINWTKPIQDIDDMFWQGSLFSNKRMQKKVLS